VEIKTSFPQLRRVRLGDGYSDEQDAAARTLLAALGLHAHQSAFGRAFALRSGTDLEVKSSESRLDSTEVTINNTASLVREALEVARTAGVPTEGWGAEPIQLTPNQSLTNWRSGNAFDLDDGCDNKGGISTANR